jgi:RNA polymerase sigma-70 factor (ECF subfamily)
MRKSLMISEGNLVKQLRKQSPVAFEYVYKTYFRQLFVFAEGYVMDEDVAEDIVQETFVGLWSKSKSIPDNVKLGGYLYRSVKNACIDYLRSLEVSDKHNKRLSESLLYSSAWDFEASSDVVDRVKEVFNMLPEKQRRIVELNVVYGQHYKEIAVDFGISESTVHTHIKRAYKFMRENIKIFVVLVP